MLSATLVSYSYNVGTIMAWDDTKSCLNSGKATTTQALTVLPMFTESTLTSASFTAAAGFTLTTATSY